MTYIIVLTLVFGVPLITTADTINGCVEQTSGKLRIVGVPAQCKANEAPIAWESEGPQGPEGPQGAQGPPGEAICAAASFGLVGFTTQQVPVTQGIFLVNEACASEFGSLSRMCTTQEVFDTPSAPTSLTGDAWVRYDSTDGNLTGVGTSNCRGWGVGLATENPRIASCDEHITLNADGTFGRGECMPLLAGSSKGDIDLPILKPVACCAPVP